MAWTAKSESVSVHPVHGNPRKGLLRTFWEPDWVLRSPLRGLCVQGALNCPSTKGAQEETPIALRKSSALARRLDCPEEPLRQNFQLREERTKNASSDRKSSRWGIFSPITDCPFLSRSKIFHGMKGLSMTQCFGLREPKCFLFRGQNTILTERFPKQIPQNFKSATAKITHTLWNRLNFLVGHSDGREAQRFSCDAPSMADLMRHQMQNFFRTLWLWLSWPVLKLRV